MDFFTASDGAKIAYRDTGTGPIFLCLSGLTRNVDDFNYMIDQFPNARFIAMDYRGRGQSEWSGPDSYTVPREAKDALELLDHLGIDKAPIIGTSRGGLIGMFLAATAKDRLAGLFLNDVGPELDAGGLTAICDYIGRNPKFKNHAGMAAKMPDMMVGYENVPATRWMSEVQHHYHQTDAGLVIKYDPALRQPVLDTFQAEAPDLWPLFHALADLPIGLVRGENSDLLSETSTDKMRALRPDMVYELVKDRPHIPFLDEPESLRALNTWMEHVYG
ncbi:MAG: alpha/beta fold hydrolase [Halocynthiibacter sp.]